MSSNRLLVTCLLSLPALTATAATSAQPVPAITGIVAAFDAHPVVIIGESHWLRQAGDFYVRLVRDRNFQARVQDIVVEFDGLLLLDELSSR